MSKGAQMGCAGAASARRMRSDVAGRIVLRLPRHRVLRRRRRVAAVLHAWWLPKEATLLSFPISKMETAALKCSDVEISVLVYGNRKIRQHGGRVGDFLVKHSFVFRQHEENVTARIQHFRFQSFGNCSDWKPRKIEI